MSMIAGRKFCRFQWGSKMFQAVRKVFLSQKSGVCFNDILPVPPSGTPCSLPALAIFIKQRMNPRFACFRVLVMKITLKYSDLVKL